MHRFLAIPRNAEEIRPADIILTFKEKTIICYGDPIINELITNNVITLLSPGYSEGTEKFIFTKVNLETWRKCCVWLLADQMTYHCYKAIFEFC